MIKAKSLFHFTEQFETLVAILKSSYFKPSRCNEPIDFNSGNFKKDEIGMVSGIGPSHNMVCFCDILLTKMSNHNLEYGNYGIGLSKKWGIQEGINPILYVNKSTRIAEDLNGLFTKIMAPDFDRQFNFFLEKGKVTEVDKPIFEKYKNDIEHYLSRWTNGEINTQLLKVMSYVKAYDNNIQNKIERYPPDYEFYNENEWRYVPKVYGQNLPFTKQDIRYIILNDKGDITRLKQEVPDLFDSTSSFNGLILTQQNIKDDF